ncbi:MAG TPA: IclR family transcriptional regulator, partial [Ramlibacter sp.]|nr:IclR family transcriptional regulator [Ramlibacter sp.]
MLGNVKSATRVLEIFEYFSRVRRAAKVTELARALGYPQSSTTCLLQNLVDLGYLRRDARTRTYHPTARVTLMGAWIDPMLSVGGRWRAVMEQLCAESGQTVLLGVPAQYAIRYIEVMTDPHGSPLPVRVGTQRPMAVSGMGRLFMSRMPAERVRGIVLHYNTAAPPGRARLDCGVVERELEQIRARGVVPSLDRLSPGVGGVSMLLRDADEDDAPIAVAIGGPSKVVARNCDRYEDLLRRAVSGA